MTQSSAPMPVLGPTRLQLRTDLTLPIAGAWLPYTTRLSDELPRLQAAAQDRLGRITDIDVNWHFFARHPGLDAEHRPENLPLMTIVAERARVTILVIPTTTSSSLAAELLRQAGPRADFATADYSHLCRRAERILRLAAAQHAPTGKRTTDAAAQRFSPTAETTNAAQGTGRRSVR